MQSTRTSQSSSKSGLTLYYAADGFSHELQKELKNIEFQRERLFLAAGSEPQKVLWAQCIGINASIHKFQSITEAVEILRSQKINNLPQKRWAHCSDEHFRRAELIQEKLFKFKFKSLQFLEELKNQDWGIWFLIDQNTLACAPTTNSILPLGLVQFQEDKINPPSRAYLKLWEFFTIYKRLPSPHETVMDLGSCPGGWTWVLANLGCNVISVDKAPIEEKVKKRPNVTYLKKDAFTLKKSDVPSIDWLFSDIICFPEKLFELVMYWYNETQVKNFVCTIKFQGETDYNSLEMFKKIPDANVTHLCHNKHEVTFYLSRKL